jgi:Flp pilus assembly protein TadG
MKKQRRLGRRFGSRRGNAMLEFAVSSLILIPLFTGVFQYGFSMFRYNELVAAVRAGIRYASLTGITNAGNSSTPASYTTKVQNMVAYGTPTPPSGATLVAPALTVNSAGPPAVTGNVSVTVTYDSKGVPTTVNVKLSSYSIDAVFGTITFTNKPSFTMPYFGKYCSTAATGQGNATC